MVWVAIGTFILGLILGAVGGVFYLRKQMTNMKMSDADIAAMARSMGVNLSQKQLAQVSKRMQNTKPGAQKAAPKKRK